jgi:hypothetical protein
MNNPFIEVKFKTTDTTHHPMCLDYWNMSINLKFVYSVRDVASKYRLPMMQVTKTVMDNAVMVVKCIHCNEPVNQYAKRSDFHPDDFRKPEFFSCAKCLRLEQNRQVVCEVQRQTGEKNPATVDKKKVDEKMKIAVENRMWNNLSQIELEILIIIAESSDRREIYEKVFYGLDINSDLRRNKWNAISKIEKLHLIWLERDGGNKIIRFHILEETKGMLRLLYPDLFFPG